METYIKVQDDNKLTQLVPSNIRIAYGYPLDIDIYFMDVLRAPIPCIINEGGEYNIKYFINTQLCDANKMTTKGADVEVSQEVKNMVIDYFDAEREYTASERYNLTVYCPLNDNFQRVVSE